MEKVELYKALDEELQALLGDERDWLANAANTAALLYQRIPHVNWLGFYFLRGEELVVGPFQGQPACVRIAPGRGVCGTAIVQRQVIVVPDVHQFPGHIACDAASRSEVVVPLEDDGQLRGVLDVDSPVTGRFDDTDGVWLQVLAETYVRCSSFLGWG